MVTIVARRLAPGVPFGEGLKLSAERGAAFPAVCPTALHSPTPLRAVRHLESEGCPHRQPEDRKNDERHGGVHGCVTSTIGNCSGM